MFEMPNFPFPTSGGVIFWNTLDSKKGWKLQQHKFTEHCRILSPNNIREAWGEELSMRAKFDRLTQEYNT